MRKEAKYIALIVFLLISLIVNFLFYNYNGELEQNLEAKDETINSILNSDSTFCSEVDTYSETIKRYVSDSSFIVNGVSYTGSDIVKLFNQVIAEKHKIEDSLFYYQDRLNETENFYQEKIYKYSDSTFVLKWQLDEIKKDYGINIKVNKNKDKYTMVKPFNKMDSAIILFPYFKDKLSKTKDGNWVITTEKIVTTPKSR